MCIVHNVHFHIVHEANKSYSGYPTRNEPLWKKLSMNNTLPLDRSIFGVVNSFVNFFYQYFFLGNTLVKKGLGKGSPVVDTGGGIAEGEPNQTLSLTLEVQPGKTAVMQSESYAEHVNRVVSDSTFLHLKQKP